MTAAALTKTPAERGGQTLSTTSKLNDIKRFIDTHIGSTALTPDLIAGDFGLSRPVLYRMFEPLGGVSSYIRRQRMARALQELTRRGGNKRIGLLARHCGYASSAGVARAFREAYGVAPRAMALPTFNRPAGDRLIDFLLPLCGRAA